MVWLKRLPQLACEDFWATEAALSFGMLAHNLIVPFERKLGWLEAVTPGSLRYWLFVTAGGISNPEGQITIKLAVPPHDRAGWHGPCARLLSSQFQDSPATRPPLPGNSASTAVNPSAGTRGFL